MMTDDDRRALGDELPSFLADPNSVMGRVQIEIVKHAIRQAHADYSDEALNGQQLHAYAKAAHAAMRNGW